MATDLIYIEIHERFSAHARWFTLEANFIRTKKISELFFVLISPGHNQIGIYDDVTHICKMAHTPRNTREGHFQALCWA